MGLPKANTAAVGGRGEGGGRRLRQYPDGPHLPVSATLAGLGRLIRWLPLPACEVGGRGRRGGLVCERALAGNWSIGDSEHGGHSRDGVNAARQPIVDSRGGAAPSGGPNERRAVARAATPVPEMAGAQTGVAAASSHLESATIVAAVAVVIVLE